MNKKELIKWLNNPNKEIKLNDFLDYFEQALADKSNGSILEAINNNMNGSNYLISVMFNLYIDLDNLEQKNNFFYNITNLVNKKKDNLELIDKNNLYQFYKLLIVDIEDIKDFSKLNLDLEKIFKNLSENEKINCLGQMLSYKENNFLIDLNKNTDFIKKEILNLLNEPLNFNFFYSKAKITKENTFAAILSSNFFNKFTTEEKIKIYDNIFEIDSLNQKLGKNYKLLVSKKLDDYLFLNYVLNNTSEKNKISYQTSVNFLEKINSIEKFMKSYNMNNKIISQIDSINNQEKKKINKL